MFDINAYFKQMCEKYLLYTESRKTHSPFISLLECRTICLLPESTSQTMSNCTGMAHSMALQNSGFEVRTLLSDAGQSDN